MTRTRLVAGFALALAAAPGGLAGQDGAAFRIAPALIGSMADPIPSLRLMLDLEHRTISVDDTPHRWRFAVDTDVPLTLRAKRNPEPLRAEAGVGLLVAAFRPAPPVPGQPPPLTAPLRWGFLELNLAVRAEALQEFDNVDIAVAAGIGYEHDRDALWFLPAVDVSLALVDCIGCNVPDAEHARSARVELEGDWSIPFIARALRLRPGGRLFHAWGAGDALATLREQDGAWGRVELAYAVDSPTWLHEVHVGWRGGRLPVALAQESVWSVGFTVVL